MLRRCVCARQGFHQPGQGAGGPHGGGPRHPFHGGDLGFDPFGAGRDSDAYHRAFEQMRQGRNGGGGAEFDPHGGHYHSGGGHPGAGARDFERYPGGGPGGPFGGGPRPGGSYEGHAFGGGGGGMPGSGMGGFGPGAHGADARKRSRWDDGHEGFEGHNPRFSHGGSAGDGEWQRRVREAQHENDRIRDQLDGLRQKHRTAAPNLSAEEEWEMSGDAETWRMKYNIAENDPWRALEVDKKASFTTIKTQYKTLAKKYHPDMAGGDPERFKKVSAAYKALQQRQKELKKYGATDDDDPSATGGKGKADSAEDADDDPWKYEHEPAKQQEYISRRNRRRVQEWHLRQAFGEAEDIERRVTMIFYVVVFIFCVLAYSFANSLRSQDWRQKRPRQLRHQKAAAYEGPTATEAAAAADENAAPASPTESEAEPAAAAESTA